MVQCVLHIPGSRVPPVLCASLHIRSTTHAMKLVASLNHTIRTLIIPYLFSALYAFAWSAWRLRAKPLPHRSVPNVRAADPAFPLRQRAASPIVRYAHQQRFAAPVPLAAPAPRLSLSG